MVVQWDILLDKHGNPMGLPWDEWITKTKKTPHKKATTLADAGCDTLIAPELQRILGKNKYCIVYKNKYTYLKTKEERH